MRIRKDDKVKIISGKSAGKVSSVIKVIPEENRIIVSKVNEVTRHQKPQAGREGGIVKLEKPIAASVAMLICPHCAKPTRVATKIERGKKVRLCKKCKEVF